MAQDKTPQTFAPQDINAQVKARTADAAFMSKRVSRMADRIAGAIDDAAIIGAVDSALLAEFQAAKATVSEASRRPKAEAEAKPKGKAKGKGNGKQAPAVEAPAVEAQS